MHEDNRIRNPHRKTLYIPDWKTWESLGEHYDFDPYKEVEFSIDLGGGNSKDYEYVGDVPKKDDE